MSRVFFTDRDLGRKFAQILREARLTVERHAEHFAADCPDEDWLQAVGERGWVAITHDRRIRYKPNELGAVVRHRVPLLVVVGRAPYPELATAFVSTLPRISSFLDSHDPPFIAKVYRPSPAERQRNRPGRVELWYPGEG